MASTELRSVSDGRPALGARVRAGLGNAAFVILGGAVVGVGSERVFWYWTTNPAAHLEIALFYAPAVAFALWAVERYRVGEWWSFMLTVPLFAYWIEGVVTPILYSGGPFVPVFPLWFTGWHGLFAFVVLWYLFRRWLLADRWRPLLATSVAVGGFWGAWAITMTLPENLADEELIEDLGRPLELLDPGAFAFYVIAFTAILMGGHYLLGRVWVTSYRPSRTARGLWLAATATMLVVWSFAFPWAAPMFVVYVGLQLWALRRHRARIDRLDPDQGPTPSLLAALDGPVALRSLWPLAAIPVTAAPVYAALWALDPSDDAVRTWQYTVIAVQSLLALAAVGYSIYRAFKPRTPRSPGPWPPPPGPPAGRAHLVVPAGPIQPPVRPS